VYALCDLARAYYYTGHVEEVNAAIRELDGLVTLLPGLEVQPILAEMEILLHDQNWEKAKLAATDLLNIAAELKHETGVGRAQRALARIEQEMNSSGKPD
jgi:hypothetical protein